MTPRQRVETVLRREVPDKTPLTMYECMIPQCEAERRLRNGGLCIVQRRGVVATHTPNVTTDSHHYAEDGKPRVRRVDGSEIEVPTDPLPEPTEIVVLQPAL